MSSPRVITGRSEMRDLRSRNNMKAQNNETGTAMPVIHFQGRGRSILKCSVTGLAIAFARGMSQISVRPAFSVRVALHSVAAAGMCMM